MREVDPNSYRTPFRCMLIESSVYMPAAGGSPLGMSQFLEQRAAVAAGAVKLDGGMRNMKAVLQFVLDVVQ